MSPFAEPFQPHWQLVHGRNRCELCGAFVQRAWCWWARPAVWTRCFCEPCAQAQLSEAER